MTEEYQGSSEIKKSYSQRGATDTICGFFFGYSIKITASDTVFMSFSRSSDAVLMLFLCCFNVVFLLFLSCFHAVLTLSRRVASVLKINKNFEKQKDQKYLTVKKGRSRRIAHTT